MISSNTSQTLKKSIIEIHAMGPGEREKFILTGPFRKCFLQVRSKTNVGNLAGNRLAEGGVLSAKG